jgi:hypothetical protein
LSDFRAAGNLYGTTVRGGNYGIGTMFDNIMLPKRFT